jgi:Ca2+-binding RTX toxin-like protein
MQPSAINLIQTYTPSSDIAIGYQPSQIVWGRTGNDTVVGLQPVASNPSQLQIDVLVGDIEFDLLPSPTPRDWSNRFILGEWQKSYYANGNSSIFGLNDFALIPDFNPYKDIIQLNGTSQDYRLFEFSGGTAILRPQVIELNYAVPDVIAVILTPNLSLDANYFKFAGYTSPQDPTLPQTNQWGTVGFEYSNNVATDLFGNVYAVGVTTGNFGRANNGSFDAWLAKYDSQGNQLWFKQIGSPDFDAPYALATDRAGNVYLSGYTEGNLGATKQASLADAWVAKYDLNGNQLWIQQFAPDTGASTANGLSVDDDGNVYLSGIGARTTEPGAILPITDDYWVAKYDTDGNRLWSQKFGNPNILSYDESYALTIDKQGNVYATGWTTGNLAEVNVGLYDIFLSKQSNDGQLEWIKQFGSKDFEWAWSTATDSDSNIYLTGWTLGDLGGKNAGSHDAWLAKFNSEGDQLWIKQFGSPGDDEAFRIYIDPLDNIFLTGYTDNGNNVGVFDAWVAKYDIFGNQIWFQQFGTPNLDLALGLSGNNAGEIYVSGLTDGSIGGFNSGSFDAWLAKLDANSGNLLDFFGDSKPVNDPPDPSLPVNYSGELEFDENALRYLLETTLGKISPFSLQPYSPLPTPEVQPDYANRPLQELDFSLLIFISTGGSFMGLRDALVSRPVVSVTVEKDGGLFGSDETITRTFNIPISIDLLLPDLQVGDAGNNTLEGNGDNRTETIVLETVSVNLFGNTVNLFGNSIQLANTPFDFLIGFGGNDTLSGSGGVDFLVGDSFSPLDGGFGDDVLNGGEGNDVLVGGGNNVNAGDVLNGGDGDDLLLGDYLLGFSLDEPILIPGVDQVPIEDFEISFFDSLFDSLGIVGDILNIGGVLGDLLGGIFGGGIEVRDTRITYGPFEIPIGSGNEGNDILSGGAGNDLVFGDLGNDILNGDEGNDTLYAGAGNDILNGGQGDDILSGDDGIDTVTYRLDPGSVTVTLGTLFIPGLGSARDGFGNQDQLSGIENIIGSSFNDLITGDTNNNVITAGAGDDIVSGGGGNDTLFGEEGNDFLDGGDGDDVLNGGPGADILNGGLVWQRHRILFHFSHRSKRQSDNRYRHFWGCQRRLAD